MAFEVATASLRPVVLFMPGHGPKVMQPAGLRV